MKTSVIIPVYNEEKYIARCLDSLMQQEEKPGEIIVVDNNCTDNTISIAKKYPVKIVQEKKQGIVFARNRGFNTADGDIIARIDADSTAHKNWVQTIKINFSQEKKIGALTGLVFFTGVPLARYLRFYFVFYSNLIRSLLGHEFLRGTNFAIKKAVWKEVKNKVCANKKFIHEDIDLSIHVAKFFSMKIDHNLIVYSSSRRIFDPFSFYFTYTFLFFRTIFIHRFNLLK